MAEPVPPKVFISYSWTNDEHKAWVLSLATRLRDEGTNVILDRWHLQHGQDKYKFMEQMVTGKDMSKVLLVCDKAYMEKANGRIGGVGDESLIMTAEIYKSAEQTKYVALLTERNEDGTECLPAFYSSRKYIDFCDPEEFENSYDELIRLIHGQPEFKPPPIGQPPKHIFQTATRVKTSGKVARLKNAVDKALPNANHFLEEYFETLIDALEDFRISGKDTDEAPFDDKVVESIAAFLPYRDEFIDCMLHVSKHLPGPVVQEGIHHFFEQMIPFQERPEGMNSWSEYWFDNYRFIATELCLYTLSILLKNKKYAEFTVLVDSIYHHVERIGGNTYTESSISALNEYPESLENTRNNRLGGGNTKKISFVGDLIHQRSTHPKIRFNDLFQTDILVFLRRHLQGARDFSNWYPRLLPYQRDGGHLELLAKATSPRGFEPLKTIFGVKDVSALAQTLTSMLQSPKFQNYFSSSRIWHLDWEEMLSIRQIVRAAGK